DFHARTQKLANALVGLGLKPGDRVATLAWNHGRHLEAYFAAPLAGFVVHTLNPRLSADDLAFIVNDAQDRVLIVDEALLPVLAMYRVDAWGLPFTAVAFGAGLVFPGPHLDATSVLDLLHDERVTFTAGVPTVWHAILEALDREPKRWDLSALRRLVVGG